jgi:oxepin-CoA hydrolase/3-oxo-5,6-dehydrosuberyl-CoA semialdehyde dehydrogenase
VKEVSEKFRNYLNPGNRFRKSDNFEVKGADKNKGAFISLFYSLIPTLLNIQIAIISKLSDQSAPDYHNHEEDLNWSEWEKGHFCCSVVTADDDFARDFVIGAASMHGRILILNSDCAKESTGHGSPLPMLIHGGPGRAGGGEEMGGKRGVLHYMQRTAIQGSPTTLTHITQQYQYGGKQFEDNIHPFRKHFEELKIGETYITAKHTVTESDITNFANVSGDNFYAHMDATSLEGTIFEGRVAHGYFILSKAAGLFVDPRKGPVLLNYGLTNAVL